MRWVKTTCFSTRIGAAKFERHKFHDFIRRDHQDVIGEEEYGSAVIGSRAGSCSFRTTLRRFQVHRMVMVRDRTPASVFRRSGPS